MVLTKFVENNFLREIIISRRKNDEFFVCTTCHYLFALIFAFVSVNATDI